MGFAQLYYTSCETGLSGFAGFQFNAATPGLTPELLRTVESLTAYKPPRWVSPRPAAAEIASCPVNLVYITEPAPILARVVFVGLDFSQRSGNYFAHALVSSERVPFGEMLPIELWESPMWASEPVSRTELPALPELPPSARGTGLSPVEVDRFARDAGRAEPLAALLTAAEEVILRDGRPIVIVNPDTAVAARWIAAVSYLLPRAVARRLTFATYHHNPGYVDVHMIGTVPDSDFSLTETAFRSYVVLEPDATHLGDVVPGPVAALLVRAGPSRAAALWDKATGLASVASEALEDWHPALVMAALLGGPEVTIADLDVLAAWLPRQANQVTPDQRAAVLSGFLDDAAFRPRHLAALGALSRLVADPELTARIERKAVTEELRRAGSDPPGEFTTGVPIVTAEGRTFAAAECAKRLAGASVRTSIALLGWSNVLGLELPEEALRRCGEQVLGPQLITAPDDDTVGVVAGARPLAEGVLAYLSSVVAVQQDAVVRVFTMGLDDITERFPGLVPDELQEARLVARAGKHPQDRVPDLRHFLGRRRRWVTADLLGRLWPEGHWTVAEARCVADTFEPDQLQSDPVYSWIAQAVLSPPADQGYLARYEELCLILAARKIDRVLPEAASRRLNSFLRTRRLIEQARAGAGKTQAQIIRRLGGSYAGLDRPAQDLSGQALVDLIDQLAGSPYLPMAVETCPAAVISAFLRLAHRRLAATPRDVTAAARLFRSLASLQRNGDQQLAPGLDGTLGEELRLWRRTDLNTLDDTLRQVDTETADRFAGWRQKHLATTLRRSWRRLLTGHAEGGP
jgi:GTPase-associated protein 1, N-terminal domain type 2/GTPase-associated protein 1, C-terminal domain/GTPase-associated protein 1, middle domain